MPVDITALKGMTRAEQLAWADKYAGVAPGTMDGIWRTETGRGSHPTLIGPETKWGTAKGHFQALDSTNETISKRVGKHLDRFDFTESLVGAATLMQENRQRYGDDAKAVMAKMREMPINDVFTKNGRLREDGMMVHDMYLFQVKSPQESKAPWDYYKVISTVPADKAFLPLSESACPLVKK